MLEPLPPEPWAAVQVLCELLEVLHPCPPGPRKWGIHSTVPVYPLQVKVQGVPVLQDEGTTTSSTAPILVLRSSVGNICLGLCSLVCYWQWCGTNKRETPSNYKMQFICRRMEHHTSWFVLFHCDSDLFTAQNRPPQCNQLNGSLRQSHLFTLSKKIITCIKASTFCFTTSPHRFGCLLEQGEDIFQSWWKHCVVMQGRSPVWCLYFQNTDFSSKKDFKSE